MIKFSIIITLFAVAYGTPLGFHQISMESRIIGGQEVKIEDYPYQISLQYYGSHRCGGSVIQPNIILTAAHCVVGIQANNLKVRAGSASKTSGGVVVDILRSIPHESYNTGTIDYDIAILVLAQPLSYDTTIQPIQMANQEATDEADAFVSGWGNQQEGVPSSPDNLKAVKIRIISNEKCKGYYGQSRITDRMMCAGVPKGGEGSCQGDSGGPLTVNGKVVGVVSWAIGCSRPNVPTVFGNVVNLLSWVNSKIQNVN